MERRDHDRKRSAFRSSELEAITRAASPILSRSVEPMRRDERPERPGHESSGPEFPSVALRLMALVLVLGFLGLALALPFLDGEPREVPSYVIGLVTHREPITKEVVPLATE